jgi:hypothetical protein
MILNDELERMGKEMAMAYLKGLLKHQAGQSTENYKNSG